MMVVRDIGERSAVTDATVTVIFGGFDDAPRPAVPSC